MSGSNPPLPPLTIGSTRSLSPRRRGSMAAPDPFGTFPDTERTMTSTLHIVKSPLHIAVQEAADKTKRLTRSRSRTHSGGITGPRISFAFSGFSSASPQRELSSGPRSPIEPTRPVSPVSGKPLFPRSNSFTNVSMLSQTPLTPIQVYDFAQQCNHPQSRPSTPVGPTSLPSSPVSFTPLPESHLLPFLDRPREVKDLLSRPVTSRLFILLAQTFPVRTPAANDADPASWTYSQLEHWLTQTGRDKVGDVEWVQKAKLCISARSELIWERVKAALGVPPELDGSFDHQTDMQSGGPDKTEGILDDEDLSDSFGNAWVEPIVATPSSSSPIPPSRSPTTPFSRSPTMGHQGVGRMEDISEDAPVSDSSPPAPATVHGLRVVVSPSETRRYSGSSTSYAGSFSQPQVPYDAVGERGPGHPLFPSTFANLALGPTLQAKCDFTFFSRVFVSLTQMRAVTPPSALPLYLQHLHSRHPSPCYNLADKSPAGPKDGICKDRNTPSLLQVNRADAASLWNE